MAYTTGRRQRAKNRGERGSMVHYYAAAMICLATWSCGVGIVTSPTIDNGRLESAETKQRSVATIVAAAAFAPGLPTERRRRSLHVNGNVNYRFLSMASENVNNDDGRDGERADDDEDEPKNESIDDLSWRVAKLRLEEANTKRLLRRKPLKLPYAVSRKWLRHNWNVKTQAEFEELVAGGDIRNVYISKRPEEYYGERGEWISWDHYLLGDDDCCDSHHAGGGNQTTLKWQ